MTVDEAKALLAKIELGWPLKQWRYKLWATLELGWGCLVIRFAFQPPDRDGGVTYLDAYGKCAFEIPLDALDRLRPSNFVRIVRDLVEGALYHELNESFLVDGVRVFDPHSQSNVGQQLRALDAK